MKYASALIEEEPAPAERRNVRKPRLSADDWAQAALDQIAVGGVASVAVESMARNMGVTKGSFYWHFPSRDALIAAALQRWEAQELRGIWKRLEEIEDPKARVREMIHIIAKEYHSHIIFAELVKAFDQPAVAPSVERISAKRVEFLQRSFELAGLNKEDALNRTYLTYSMYVGFLQLNMHFKQMKMDHEKYDSFVEHLIKTLAP